MLSVRNQAQPPIVTTGTIRRLAAGGIMCISAPPDLMLKALRELQDELDSAEATILTLTETIHALSENMRCMESELEEQQFEYERLQLKLQALTFVEYYQPPSINNSKNDDNANKKDTTTTGGGGVVSEQSTTELKDSSKKNPIRSKKKKKSMANEPGNALSENKMKRGKNEDKNSSDSKTGSSKKDKNKPFAPTANRSKKKAKVTGPSKSLKKYHKPKRGSSSSSFEKLYLQQVDQHVQYQEQNLQQLLSRSNGGGEPTSLEKEPPTTFEFVSTSEPVDEGEDEEEGYLNDDILSSDDDCTDEEEEEEVSTSEETDSTASMATGSSSEHSFQESDSLFNHQHDLSQTSSLLDEEVSDDDDDDDEEEEEEEKETSNNVNYPLPINGNAVAENESSSATTSLSEKNSEFQLEHNKITIEFEGESVDDERSDADETVQRPVDNPTFDDKSVLPSPLVSDLPDQKSVSDALLPSTERSNTTATTTTNQGSTRTVALKQRPPLLDTTGTSGVLPRSNPPTDGSARAVIAVSPQQQQQHQEKSMLEGPRQAAFVKVLLQRDQAETQAKQFEAELRRAQKKIDDLTIQLEYFTLNKRKSSHGKKSKRGQTKNHENKSSSSSSSSSMKPNETLSTTTTANEENYVNGETDNVGNEEEDDESFILTDADLAAGMRRIPRPHHYL